MGEPDLAVRLAEVDERCKTNSSRIDKLEEAHEALYSIATSVAVLANEQKNITEKVDSIDEKVDKLERIPAHRWNGFVDRIIFAVAGGVVAWILSMILK